MISRTFLCIGMFIAALLNFSPLCEAEWKVTGESYLFYTDDAALFSATRRLSRNQDPTQPVLDRELAGQGDDIIYEPAAQVSKSLSLLGGVTEFTIRAQGYIFADNGRYDQASLGVDAHHELTDETEFLFRYYFNPDLFLGENEVRTPLETDEEKVLDKEEVTTNFWAAGLSHRLGEEMTIAFYGRYGLRRYNKSFEDRDTDFWTIGTHLEWDVSNRVKLAFGYHYERGFADGRHQPELKDDLSYINNFVTGELTIEPMKRLELEMAMHYERNDWTTNIDGDERNDQHEIVAQGDFSICYRLTDVIELTTGFQYSYRKESFESALQNYNTSVGVQFKF